MNAAEALQLLRTTGTLRTGPKPANQLTADAVNGEVALALRNVVKAINGGTTQRLPAPGVNLSVLP